MTKEEALNACTIEGNVVKLPSQQLDRQVYLEVKKALEKIGGKWKGGKVFGFVFDHDPSDLLADVQSGKDRNIKKELQFFETPEEVARELVNFADLEQGQLILEPSAGRGAIIKAIREKFPLQPVHFFEIDQQNRDYINDNFGNVFNIGDDFLKSDAEKYAKFDRIIANPPFSKNQDIEHVQHMYNKYLKEGGRLVSVMSKHWTFANDKASVDFRAWLEETDSIYHDIPDGSFASSGTGVATVFVMIDK